MTPSEDWRGELHLAADNLFEEAPDGYVVIDADGVIRLANRQLHTMLGYTPHELLGRPIETLIPTTYQSEHVHQRRRFSGAPRQRPMGDPRARVSALHHDGSLLPVEISLSPIALSTGPATFAAVRDVSKRLSIEAELDAIRRSLDIIDHGVLLIRPGDLSITYANAGATYQTGFSTTEMVASHTLVDLCTDLDLNRLRRLVAPLLSGTVQSLTQLTTFARRHGDPLPVELTLSYPVVSAGFARPLVAMTRNISERIRVDRERDRREQLLGALAEIRRSALAEVSAEEVLSAVARAALHQLEAQHVLIASTMTGRLWCRAMASTTTMDLTGAELASLNPAVHDQILLVQNSADPLAAQLHDALGAFGPALVAPLVTDTSIEGVLVVVRPVGGRPFTQEAAAVGTALAAEAAITLVLDQARDDRRYLAVIEDRERIARDLHDLVIQRLFATGMGLQASLGSPARLSDKAIEAITDLDETIAVIRRAIFALTRADGLGGVGFRGELDRLIDRHRAVGRNHIRLEITGDVDALPSSHQAQLLPALNELLSNVERHANAESAEARIEVGPGVLALTVIDDGDGIDPDAPRGYGLRNLEIRAQLLDGRIEHSPGPDGSGTKVVWAVPLDPRLP